MMIVPPDTKEMAGIPENLPSIFPWPHGIVTGHIGNRCRRRLMHSPGFTAVSPIGAIGIIISIPNLIDKSSLKEIGGFYYLRYPCQADHIITQPDYPGRIGHGLFPFRHTAAE